MEKKKEIYIGEMDYKNLSSKYYYVDKTLFVKDIIDRNAKVSLITRPRRFGKTLNMDMLQTFFEKTDEDNSVYFRDKKIWEEGEDYTCEQGKYPVIFISFKDARFETWEKTYEKIEQALAKEFRRHNELIESDKVDKGDLRDYMSIYNHEADEVALSGAISLLAGMLYAHYGVKPIVLIDEYDEPIQCGYTNGYYKQAVTFIGSLFSDGLKDGKTFDFAVLTGILRVSKESIFSGLNNPVTYTVLDQKYSRYFGFTLDEVKEMLEYYGHGDKLDEVLSWYDGYMFGETEIFNPFSLTNYIANNCDPKQYWVNTSGNGILGDLLKKADGDMESKLARLFQGETIQSSIAENVVYADLNKKEGRNKNIFSILLFSGYLKSLGKAERDESRNVARMAAADGNAAGVVLPIDGEDEYLLKIPNREVRAIFRTEVMERMQVERSNLLTDIWSALQKKDAPALEDLLRDYLLTAASMYDVGGRDVTESDKYNNEYEAFYHGMWMGFSAYTSEHYYTTSNRESGEGRYDLVLEPMDEIYPAIILEFKHLRDKRDTLQGKAKEALAQIDEMCYDADLKKRGCKNIIKIGIAFLGKNVAVAM